MDRQEQHAKGGTQPGRLNVGVTLTAIFALVAALMSASPVAATERYEVVIQDGQYLYVIDSAANTKTWAGHCDGQLGTPRPVGWNDIKDLTQTDTPSCDELVQQLGSTSGPVDEPASPTTPANQPVDQPEPQQRSIIVSMGDSFISGESGHLIGNNSAENRGRGIYENGTDPGCRRSDVAPINSANISGVDAVNIACSGAVTSDIGNRSQARTTTGRHGEPLQIHQLEDLAAANNIEMVAVSIGGNDAGFEQLTTACALAYASGSDCENNGAGTFERVVETTMANNVAGSLRQIRAVLNEAGHSDARVVLFSYPSPVPAVTYYDTLQRLNHGCGFKASDMRYIRTSFVPLLDATLERVANNEGVDFLSLSDAFDGKELCSPDTTGRDATSDQSRLEWATGIRVTGQSATPESIHPNALGQRAIGQCLRLVWNSRSSYNKCYNNDGQPSNMRLGGRDEVTFDEPSGETPICQTGPGIVDPDPDADGWGWQNSETCLMTLEDVTCDVGVDGLEERICKLLLNKINQDLETADLGIDRDGLLVEYHDPTDRKISGSCSNRLYITDQRASAVVSNQTRLIAEGDALKEPVLLTLNVPFSLDVAARFRSEQNYRFFGSCNDISSDSYTVTGDARGTAQVTTLFDLGTEIEDQPNGDVHITITPDVFVGVNINNPDIDNLRSSGVNPLAQLIGATSSVISGSTELTGAILGGDSIGDVLSDRGFELGANVGSVLLGPVNRIVWAGVIEEVAEMEIRRNDSGVIVEAEQKLRSEITDALSLDGNGQRTWVVPANTAELLRNGVTLERLLSL